MKRIIPMILIVMIMLSSLAGTASAYLDDNSSIYLGCGKIGKINSTTGAYEFNSATPLSDDLLCSKSGVDNDPLTKRAQTHTNTTAGDFYMIKNVSGQLESTKLFKAKIDWKDGYAVTSPANTFPWKLLFLDENLNTVAEFTEQEIPLDGFWGELPRVARNYMYVATVMTHAAYDTALNIWDINVASGVFLADFKITMPTDNYITKYDLQVVNGMAPIHTFMQATTSNVGYYEIIPPQASVGFKFGTNSDGAGNIEDLSEMIRVFNTRFTTSGYYPIVFNVWETGLNPDIDPRSFEVVYNVFYDANRTTALVPGENDPTSPGIEPQYPIPPENAWDIIGWLAYIVDWIIFLFEVTVYMLKLAGDQIKTLILATTGLASILESFFSFLPPEVLTVMIVGITVVVLLRIFGR